MNRFLKQMTALLLCAVLLFGQMAIGANAARTDNGVISESAVYINPLYADQISEKDLVKPSAASRASIAPENVVYATTVEEAGATLREQLKAREESCVTYLRVASYDNSLHNSIFDSATSHTGDPLEGDYLLWHYGGYRVNTKYTTSSDGYIYATFTYTMTYYTTLAQEAELDHAVNNLLAELNLNGASEYQRLRGVYDYICENIVYDYDNLEDSDYKLKFSAYAAMINKTAVCQGYASLLYRLALTLGLDCRIVVSEDHAWNIVKIDNQYYNADPTWDAIYRQAGAAYNFFLRCNANFGDHTPTKDWEAMGYYISETDYVPTSEHPVNHALGEWIIITAPTCTEAGSQARFCVYDGCNYSEPETIPATGHNYAADTNQCVCGAIGGYCGDLLDNYGKNMTWAWDVKTKTLTISGTGMMEDYSGSITVPWKALTTEITHIVINEGVSSIGGLAFRECVNLVDVDFADSITEIGMHAFDGCKALKSVELPENLAVIEVGVFQSTGLTSIIIPSGVQVIDQCMFAYCASLKTVVIPGSVKKILKAAFWGCENLESVTLQGGIESIGSEVFYNCDKLTEVSIPDSVTEIHGCAFEDCDGLTSIEISKNVIYIGEQVFFSCDNLSGIWVDDENSNYSSDSFGVLFNKEKTELIQMIGGLKGSYVVPEHVTTIGSNAFTECNLEAVTLPSNLVSINAGTFSSSKNLRYIVIPASVTEVGMYAFYGCNNLWHVLYTGTEAQWNSISIAEENDPLHLTTRHYQASGNEIIPHDDSDCQYNRLFRCTICNSICEERIENGNHSWDSGVVIAPTCIADGYTTYTCTRCNTSYVDSIVTMLGHNLGDWIVDEAATCTTDGSQHKKCSRCDHTETGVITKLEHSYQAVVTAPTCTADGYTTYTCSCGDTYTGNPVVAPGHSWDEGTVTKEPTEETTGVLTYTCGSCGETKTDSIPTLDHAHQYVSVVTEPTCTEDGYTTHTCSGCGHSYQDSTVAKLGHDLGNWIVDEAATCTTDGSQHRECSRCDHTETGVITKLEHSYQAVVTAPTCIADGYTTHTCSRCNASYVDSAVTMLGHNLSDWIVDEAATCTADGSQHKECSRCDHTETDVIQKLGHTEEIDEAVDPTCGETGLTEGKHCAVCGDILIKQETVPATGEHSFVDGECEHCGQGEGMLGDFTGDNILNDRDAYYLLRHTLLPSKYPVTTFADFNHDGIVNDRDAYYLLRHTLLPSKYPITTTPSA